MVKRIVLNPFEFRWNVYKVSRDGYEWECFTTLSWHWHWCIPWCYKIWYDGWYYSLHCGIGSWCIHVDSTKPKKIESENENNN